MVFIRLFGLEKRTGPPWFKKIKRGSYALGSKRVRGKKVVIYLVST